MAHGSPLLIHSRLDAFLAASVVFLVSFFLCSPLIPNNLRALQSDRPANPQHPTSMGLHRVIHPLRRHSPANSSYLALFLSNASSIRSSQGTVNSSSITCLVDSDMRTKSGLSVVTVMVSGNLSCLPRSTFRCQSLAVVRSPPVWLGRCCDFSPALTKVMECLAGCCCLLSEIPEQMVSAITFSTWSWPHL